MLGPHVRTLDTRTAKPAKKTAAAFYRSPEWRRFVDWLVSVRFGDRARAHCEDKACKQPHRRGISVYGDHIHELADGGARLDPRNVLFRCGSCHTRKTNEARAERNIGGG